MNQPPAKPDQATIEKLLASIGQQHVLTYFSHLNPEQQSGLLEQLTSLNASLGLSAVPGLVDGYVKKKPATDTCGAIEPVPFYPLNASGPKQWDHAAYKKKGEDLIRAGKVAAFTVAGGQGTRLGYDGPKGCFPGGAVTGKPLFKCLAEWILAAQKRWCPPGTTIPWYIMTSPLNYAATAEFFEKNAYLGLRKQDVMLFTQGVMPAFEMGTGKMLLSEKHELALSPDGHGGSLTALYKSGAIADMKRRGVEHLSYTQIDNPLVRVIDPVFLGLHAFAPDSSGEMTSKMIPKANPGEKVGVFCKVGGRTAMIEYSDLPAELANMTDSSGKAVYNAGNPAIHALSVAFIEGLNTGAGGVRLPFHRAEKKVPFVDLATGKRIEPEKPNAIKLEMFVFDALSLAKKSIVVETDRAEEFAPIKNATGIDSVESCRAMQTARAAKWLETAGVKAPHKGDGTHDCVLEMSPLKALYPEDLAGWKGTIAAGTKVEL